MQYSIGEAGKLAGAELKQKDGTENEEDNCSWPWVQKSRSVYYHFSASLTLWEGWSGKPIIAIFNFKYYIFSVEVVSYKNPHQPLVHTWTYL